MARCAADALRDMNRVIEINVIRKIVNARPVNRDAALPTIANGRKIGRRREKLRVAIHARLDRGYSGGGRSFNGGVAIPAVDTVIADVMLVAELDGLELDDVFLIPVGGARNPKEEHVNREHGERARTNNRGSRERVRTLPKNLRHQAPLNKRIRSDGTPAEAGGNDLE